VRAHQLRPPFDQCGVVLGLYPRRTVAPYGLDSVAERNGSARRRLALAPLGERSGQHRADVLRHHRPRLPERDWTRTLIVPGTKRSARAPQHQQWAGYPTPADTIRPIMLAVNCGGRSILLTDGMWVSGILKCLNTSCTDLRSERPRASAPGAQRIVDNGLSCCHKDAALAEWPQ
jgi:hypothetical protein